MKSPLERSVGYTVVVFLIGLVLSWVIGATVTMVSGAGAFLSGASMRTGSSQIKFDENSGLGKLAAISAQMESVSKKLEAAQKSGDADATAAATSAMLGAALGGGDKVEALAPSVLKGFVPETLDGLPRKRLRAEKNRAMGLQIASARADYSNDEGRSLQLEITDTGGAKGLMGLASWALVEQESETDTGYDKTFKSDGRLIHEQWDRESKRGEYAITLGQRFMVKVEGEADSIENLQGAVGSIDLAALEALKD